MTVVFFRNDGMSR